MSIPGVTEDTGVPPTDLQRAVLVSGLMQKLYPIRGLPWSHRRKQDNKMRTKYADYEYYFKHCSNKKSVNSYYGSDMWACDSYMIDKLYDDIRRTFE